MGSRIKAQTFKSFSLPNAKFSWTAACWQMLSCACFACINGVVRYLGGGGSLAPEIPLSPHMILFFQNIFGTLCLLPLLMNPSRHSLLPQKNYVTHFLRILSGVLGVILWYFALQQMPIAMGLALTFTGPVFTIIGSRLLLGEAIGGKRGIAILLSLMGAFIISRPDRAFASNSLNLGFAVLLPVGSAMALVVSKLLTRQLASKGETAESLATYLLLLMTPVSLLIALPEWQAPQLAHFPWLIGLGLLAACAHVSFGKAYAKAEVTALMPFGFSKFLFSSLIGYFCFLEIPTLSLIFGLIFTSFSILLLTNRS